MQPSSISGSFASGRMPSFLTVYEKRRVWYRRGQRTSCSVTDSPNKPVHSGNKRFGHQTSLCAQRTSGSVTEQACAVNEQAVRSPNKPVRSGNKRFGHQTSLCAQRTSGSVTDRPWHIMLNLKKNNAMQHCSLN